ncbi:hypothetical protein BDB01DRAFT_853037 [Pilobolus umbonatus]|nr:hypothetical protein BDB01DRAFT_853037 [Pilobolus umbonatus]
MQNTQIKGSNIIFGYSHTSFPLLCTMVVLAAAVISKTGKVILSRHFCPLQRPRIEGLLTCFPKHVHANQEHTTVETDTIRYIYQPLDNLYVVVITNKQSNILNDLDSLHLFVSVVTDLVRICDEQHILKKVFEILIAFDEIITEGYRDCVQISQIRTNIKMESQEEKNQEIIAINKEREAKEELKRRAKQFKIQRKEASKRGEQFMQGHYSESAYIQSGYSQISQSTSKSTYADNHIVQSPSSIPTVSPAKGMKLMKKGKTSNLLTALQTQIDEPLIPATSSAGVHINIVEKVSMSADRDGDLDRLDIRGVLIMRITDPENGYIRFIVNDTANPGINFKTHPNIDREAFKFSKSVQMKNSNKSFPLDQDLEMVRWKHITQDEKEVPLSISCWPFYAGNNVCNLNVEYDLEMDHMELHDVTIDIPFPINARVDVSHCIGHYDVNIHKGILKWNLATVNRDNRSGTLECSISGDDMDAFFPVSVSFTSNQLISQVDVSDILNIKSDSFINFSKEIHLSTGEYVIGKRN